MTGKRKNAPKDAKQSKKPSQDEATTQSETRSQTDKPKNPVGRPSAYGDHPTLIEDYLTLASQGKSIAQISASLGIWRSVLYRWAEQNPEFQDTIAQGKILEMAFWENEQQDNMDNQNYHMNCWFKCAKFRFKDDYGETAENKQPIVNTGTTYILPDGTDFKHKG